MMAISGRCRFGGFSPAIIASCSSCAIAGGAAAEGAGAGSEKIQAPAMAAKSTIAPSALHKIRREFIVGLLASHLFRSGAVLLPRWSIRNGVNPAKTVMRRERAAASSIALRLLAINGDH
jgi:hypothetical protein